MNKIAIMLRGVYYVVATFVLLLVLLFFLTSLSPIYRFAAPQPFAGPDIFDPYSTLDTTAVWRRATMHTHTRVDGALNECKYWPEEVIERYEPFGYDYVGISNHNEITPHPKGEGPDIYEHGYNLRNFHLLVIGAERVNHCDAPMPLLTSQLQWQLDMLRDECELLQINHPVRTPMLDKETFERLAGYDIMELAGGLDYLENDYWDWALSAGHYSYGMLGDDLHDPDTPIKIASRCILLASPTTSEQDILATLRRGCFYSLRVPNYGGGNWEVKIERNRSLPRICDIGLRGDTIHMELSAVADSIVVYGQHHTVLATSRGVSALSYRLKAEDSYGRFVAYLPDRVVIMSNPFARYDASEAAMPGHRATHNIDLTLTLLYNLALVGVVVLLVWLYIRYVIGWRRDC